MEEALRQSKERLADTIGSAMDGIIAVDEQQRIVVFNAAAEEMFGYTASEMLGQPLDRLIPERFRVAHAGHIRKFEQTHVTHRRAGDLGTIIGLRASGEEFPIEASISQTTDSGARLFTVILRDVTERRLAEQLRLENVRLEEKSRLLEEANRIKSEFIANMSHELRTPLNHVIGFTEFLVDEKPGPVNAKQKEYLEDVLSSSKHLLQLVSDILDLAKVLTGEMELHPERFSLRTAIEETCAAFDPMAQKKGIHIDVDIAHEIGDVLLDRKKFKQVLDNLLSNAIKFNHDGGKVEVIAKLHDTEHVELVVNDNGIGIKAGDLGKLFKEFAQLDSGTTRRHEGTGLGLALTRKIVELQGGEVTVVSEVGKGSSFTVVLPLVMTDAKV